MIVDLMRNDLGPGVRGRFGRGQPPARRRELRAGAPAGVSTVEGVLRPGLGAVDAVAACFPAGSMTGAPKLSAMRILNRLEDGPRGRYAGCFGYLALDGSADLAMVIRSIHFAGGVATIGAGGGITALSVPEEELEEVAGEGGGAARGGRAGRIRRRDHAHGELTPHPGTDGITPTFSTLETRACRPDLFRAVRLPDAARRNRD